jgi:cleavage and polyadenylation specificity factor subunit 1
MSDQFGLNLVSPITWTVVDSYDLEEHEHGVCMKTLLLTSSQTARGLKSFFVIGTAYVFGEDHNCRGRVREFYLIRCHHNDITFHISI